MGLFGPTELPEPPKGWKIQNEYPIGPETDIELARREIAALRAERDEAMEAARFLAFNCGEKLRRQAMEKYPFLKMEDKR
jgi:hypothetical protein